MGAVMSLMDTQSKLVKVLMGRIESPAVLESVLGALFMIPRPEMVIQRLKLVAHLVKT